MRRVCIGIAAVLLCFPGQVAAQTRRTHWGISGSVTPSWTVPSSFKVLFDADQVTLDGTELRVGLVRGSILKGDWGISFVRKGISDNAEVQRHGPCSDCNTFVTSSNAYMNGVEISKFAPFGTIHQRVQIGIEVAGGVASIKGTAQRRLVLPTGDEIVTDVDAGALITPRGTDEIVPLARVELAVAAIVAPDLKIRVTGGLDLPGYAVTISAVYLFGAR